MSQKEITKRWRHCDMCIDCALTASRQVRQMIAGESEGTSKCMSQRLWLSVKQEIARLYKKARQGLIKQFTGVNDRQASSWSDVEMNTADMDAKMRLTY